MKKFALLLAIALPLGFASCGDETEDDGFAISDHALNVDWNTSVKLSTNESKDVTWLTDNDFVATVDANGNVTAKHVGVCKITATWKGESDQCTITVVPVDNNYVMPFITWGANEAAVKAAVKGFEFDAANSTATDLRYYSDLASYSYPAYQYLLDNSGLYSSTLIDGLEQSNDGEILAAWLEQYYEYLDDETSEDIQYSDGTQVVTVDFPEDLDVVFGIWSKPATKGSDYVAKAKAAARKMVKK